MNGHLPVERHAKLIQFPGPASAGSKDDPDGSGSAARNRPRPAWHALYVLAAVAMLFFLAVDAESPTGGWRILMECLATLLIIGAMAVWVHANRAALALANASPWEGTLDSAVTHSSNSRHSGDSMLPD